ncbi:MAG: hypothetical protein GX491_21615 [Chloroflexi bacterium]|nr:hypothetical protein [Chloroflexota bacterium]
MSQDRKKYDDDDGRVIVDMNVEGMPWFNRRARREQGTAQHVPTPREEIAQFVHNAEQMTDSEARRYTWNALLAGLLIVGVFAAVWVLFILFCIYVWFR